MRRTKRENSVAGLIALLCFGLVSLGCTDERARFDALEQQLRSVNRKLDLLEDHLTQQGLGRADEQAPPATDELEQELIAADAAQEKQIVEQQLLRASNFQEIAIDTVEDLVDCLTALNTILGYADLDGKHAERVEAEQTRLISLLQDGVPAAVRELDRSALAVDNYREAQTLWSDASKLLEYYPSSNDPMLERHFEQVVAAHQQVAARLELRQEQRYNQWACSRIKQAMRIIDQQPPAACGATCIEYIGPIDPGLLEPLSLDIYSEFLETVRRKLPLAQFYELAETLSVVERKGLLDIHDDSPVGEPTP